MNAQLPKLTHLPTTLPLDGAIRIELVDGIPIFRASEAVQNRIELLLAKQEKALSAEENQELDSYAEMDDYLSFVNRTVRNLYMAES